MRIPTPTVGEIITEEFLKPLNLTPAILARELKISNSFTVLLLNGKIQITPELSKKLADYFGMTPLFFYRLQTDINTRNSKQAQSEEKALEMVQA